MTATLAPRRSEQGFTLVELAIVMIIIGLLIGGILKGQELIANARIASTVAQVKGIDAATTTFRDKYAAMPGDMSTASTRLPPSCAGAACANGDGDTRVEETPLTLPTTEGRDFFPHLAAADLLGGITLDGSGGWGDRYPGASVTGGFWPGYHVGGALGNNANAPAGHYLSLVLVANAAPTATTTALTPNQAQRIDTKLDDGVSDSGSVFGSVAACEGTNHAYAENVQTANCDLAIRFQN